MKLVGVILFLCMLNIGSAQTESDRSDIVSIIIHDQLGIGTNTLTEKLLFITSVPRDISEDLIYIDNIAKDTIEDYVLTLLYRQTYANENFMSNTIRNPEIKYLIKSFAQNYRPDGNYSLSELDIENIELEEISAKCFNKLFNRKPQNRYKRIKRKFDTTKTVAFSDIEFHQEYAVLYYEHYCGNLCGTGSFIILEKKK